MVAHITGRGRVPELRKARAGRYLVVDDEADRQTARRPESGPISRGLSILLCVQMECISRGTYPPAHVLSSCTMRSARPRAVLECI